METVIEHIAHVLNKPAHAVREANFYDLASLPPEKQVVPNGKKLTHYTIPVMWPKLKAESKFDERWAQVQAYNATNRFTKRGLSMTPVRYEVSVWNRSALVNVYGDGSVVVSHSGTEMGQGINTKAAQVASYALGQALGVEVPLTHIRFDDLRSDSVPNASFTGGSTGSEATCECVRRCSEMLVARLKPVAVQPPPNQP
jgi:xanthine dehydrogenase molybdopterin-binding subunit B